MMTKPFRAELQTYWLNEVNRFSIFRLALILSVFIALACPIATYAGNIVQDINCELNSLLGGNCSEIDRINQYQEKQQAEWLGGSISAATMVRNIVAFHQNLTPIDRYNKELYLYNFQVAQACDAGKISKEQGLYFMTKNENEIHERQSAGQPPMNRPFTCMTETFGGTTTTKCQ